MFFPTGLIMVMLIVAFVWCNLQQYRLPEGEHTYYRLFVLGALVILMFLVVLYNATSRWLSTAFLLLALAALGLDAHLHRLFRRAMVRAPKRGY